VACRQKKGSKSLPIKTLPKKIDALADGILLGNFENGSPEWHALRNEPGVVGGSEIAAVAGLSAYESAYTKWAKKTNKISSDIKPSHRMRLGTKFEMPILEVFEEDHPELQVYITGTWANKSANWMRANPDGLYKTKDGNWGIIEVKFSAEYWTAPPQHYRAQVLWYMLTMGIYEAKLIGVVGGNYVEYEVEWDKFEADSLLNAAERFRQHVLKDVAPDWDGSLSTFETVRQLNPHITDAETDLDDLGMHYFNKLDDYQRIEKELTELKSRVLAAMNGNKRGLVYGEHLLSLRSRGGGLPYLHHEK
jgi:putative phage-type endonuclease